MDLKAIINKNTNEIIVIVKNLKLKMDILLDLKFIQENLMKLQKWLSQNVML
jgi:hypothetical protein